MRVRYFKKLAVAFCALSVCAAFLPWFSLNPQMTGYYWGTEALPLALAPFACIFVCLAFLDMRKLIFKALMELSLIAVPCIYYYHFLYWPVLSLRGSAADFDVSLSAARPGFWLALILAALAAVVSQPYIIFYKEDGGAAD